MNLASEVASGRRDIGDLNGLCRPCNALEYIERRFPDLKDRVRVVWDTPVRVFNVNIKNPKRYAGELLELKVPTIVPPTK